MWIGTETDLKWLRSGLSMIMGIIITGEKKQNTDDGYYQTQKISLR